MDNQREKFVESLKVPLEENRRAKQLMKENPKLKEEEALQQAFLDMLKKSFGKEDIEGVDR